MSKKDYIPPVDERGFLVNLQDLKKSYQATLRGLKQQRQELEAIIEESSGMSLEEMGQKKNRSAYKTWKQSNDYMWNEYSSIRESISDVNYVIEWLEHGKRPGNMRGIERRSVYQNTILVDPHVLQSYVKPYESRSSTTVSDEQRDQINSALAKLSPREREVFMLVKGQGFSSDYAANLLCISKGSVDEMIQRAHKKFSEEIQMLLW